MGKIMGIDYGDARIGLAFSDITGVLVGEAFTLHEHSLERAVDAIVAAAQERQVEEIVLGYPKNMNATVGVRAEKSEALAEILRARTGLPVILWDERQTTVAAHQILNQTGTRRKKRKNTVDAVAATLILQGYLDFKSIQNKRDSGNS